MGDPMLKIEKCCEGHCAPPTPQKSKYKFRVIWLSMIKDSHCKNIIFEDFIGFKRFTNLNQVNLKLNFLD